jgi:general secretion pathway protein G
MLMRVRDVLARSPGKDGRGRGFTIVELLVTLMVLLVLASVAVPSARFALKRQKELELRRALRDIRSAIDQYKKYCDANLIQKEGVDSECYPTDLDVLVDGVDKVGTVALKVKFLRRIPLDPFTKSKDWGKRSLQDDPDSHSWGQENVYDVYTTYDGTALDGTKYQDW